jgi:hypothetical protein
MKKYVNAADMTRQHMNTVTPDTAHSSTLLIKLSHMDFL